MKDILKKIVAILVIVAIFVGIYFILPEYPQNYVKGMVQSVADVEAKAMIDKVKQLPCKDVDNHSYEEVLTKNTTTGCWSYLSAEDSSDGYARVYYYGRGASVNLKDWPDYGGMLYTSAIVKVEFKIVDKNVEIYPYIDDLKNPVYIDDKGVHFQQNGDIKKDIFQQLYNGVKSEN